MKKSKGGSDTKKKKFKGGSSGKKKWLWEARDREGRRVGSIVAPAVFGRRGESDRSAFKQAMHELGERVSTVHRLHRV